MSSEVVPITPVVYYYRGLSLTREKVLALLVAESEEEFRSVLKDTWLADVEVDFSKPELLEKEALKKYLKILGTLRSHASSMDLKLLIEVMRDYVRARDVMLLLRAKISNKPIEEIEEFIVFEDDPLIETLKSLLRERGFEGLAQGLKGFRMAKDIEYAVDLYRSTGDERALVLALDKALLESLLKLTTKIGKKMNVGMSRIEFSKLLCPRIDTLSFVMAARLVIEGATRKIEIPSCSPEVVSQILQSNKEDIVPILRRTPYGEELPDNIYEALSKVLVNGKRIQRRRAEAAFAGYPFRLSTLVALMILYRLDAEDVATIASGKKLGIEVSKVSEMLSFEVYKK